MYRDHGAEASFLSRPANAAGGSSSESSVKRGDRVIGTGTELVEKLGRNDPCPCGTGRRFPPVLPPIQMLGLDGLGLEHRRCQRQGAMP
jgi:hypothetical protein